MNAQNGKYLLLHQRRKGLVVGAVLLAVWSSLVLFPGSIGELAGVESWHVALAGIVLFTVTLFTVARSLRCPACGINLFLYGLANAPNGNWLHWLLTLSICPRCSYKVPNSSKVTMRRG